MNFFLNFYLFITKMSVLLKVYFSFVLCFMHVVALDLRQFSHSMIMF